MSAKAGDENRPSVPAGAKLRAFEWSSSVMVDAVILSVVLAVVLGVLEIFDLPRHLFEFSVRHENWGLDNIVAASFAAAVGFLIYAVRRLRELRQEIHARRKAEGEAQRLARHDPLTGLPNRRCFNERLADALTATLDDGHRVAVLILDLDGFKPINDVHGHLTGDQALIEFAARVSEAAKGANGVMVARVGGDEFAIVLPAITSLDEPARLARRIGQAIADSFVIAGAETTLGVSIGIAVAPDDGTTADVLLRRADRALYRAKAEGRSCTRFFEPTMDAHVERRTAIERELRAAVAAKTVDVHYQPLVSLTGDRIIGFEALARWHSRSFGDIAPEIFIAIAEECGLIHRLGDQLLRQACREAINWPDDFSLSFNISAVQLRDPTFGLRVLGILGETHFPPARLELEITESAIVGDALLAQRLIDELRAAGVRVALDDFGTGYATMSQLLAFRFDKIKIDRSFVKKLGEQHGSDVIVKAIIGLAQGLGLTTTAEGIETADQLADLKADGCVEGQGYLFGKAIPASEIPALLRHPSIADVA